MEHATALVTDDATTPFTCGCQRLVDAGWAVNCAACGRVTEGSSALLTVTLRTAPPVHTCTACEACMAERAADAEADEGDAAYQAQRDDEAVAEAERRVA